MHVRDNILMNHLNEIIYPKCTNAQHIIMLHVHCSPTEVLTVLLKSFLVFFLNKGKTHKAQWQPSQRTSRDVGFDACK